MVLARLESLAQTMAADGPYTKKNLPDFFQPSQPGYQRTNPKNLSTIMEHNHGNAGTDNVDKPRLQRTLTLGICIISQ